jgi:hypothetical protein
VLKWLCVPLLVLNVLALSHWMGWIDLGLEDPREPSKSSLELKPEAITLNPAIAPVAPLQCLQWPDLLDSQMIAVRNELEKIASPNKADVLRREVASSFLVYWPPAESMAQANRRVQQLKGLGVNETHVFADGDLRLAVSLGLYRSREGAQNLVNALHQQGILAIRLQEYERTILNSLNMRTSDPVQIEALKALSSKGEGWQSRECPLQDRPN